MRPLYFPFSLRFLVPTQACSTRSNIARRTYRSFIFISKFWCDETLEEIDTLTLDNYSCIFAELSRAKFRRLLPWNKTMRDGDGTPTTMTKRNAMRSSATGNPIQWTWKSVIFVGARNDGHAYPRRVISRAPFYFSPERHLTNRPRSLEVFEIAPRSIDSPFVALSESGLDEAMKRSRTLRLSRILLSVSPYLSSISHERRDRLLFDE